MVRLSSLFSNAERAGGSPVELYTFVRGLETWRYTSGDRAQTQAGLTYTPAKLQRKAMEQKRDVAGEQIKVTISLETDFGQALLDPGFQIVWCHIQRMQSAGDPISPVVMGKVMGVSFSDNDAELTIATPEQEFKTPIPKTRVQNPCPWDIYSTSCGVNKDDFAIETTIAAVSGGSNQWTITIADSQPDGVLNAGILRLANGRVLFIAKNVGAVVTGWGTLPPDVAEDDAVTIYRGCDKSFTTCEGVFNNAANYGGFPNLPNRNALIGQMF